MKEGYLPSPVLATPGQPPQVGQQAQYKTQSGTLYTGVIWWVGHHSPAKKYFNVKMTYAGSSGPVTGEWLYDVAAGQVLYTPPGPPWP